ncbi:MAG: peptide-methionine (S)-S-oxide reductase MsrA [Halofilum sp. (in: g-proteobacteria)]|nr:peptide-methionine (S)-S-oxide reductase MsrA [Halofilum sp. (in: g-proteobacteria)]
MATAIFAAGCFWHVEHAFRQLEGVQEVESGYIGGQVENPSYRQVCSGDTGHAEAVRVEYDPDRIGYEQLLDTFWDCHDPTQLNRQGPDVGSQYRSAIFYLDEAQREAAERSKNEQAWSGRHRGPIVTEITPAGTFYRAEEYHQRYFEKNGIVCGV